MRENLYFLSKSNLNDNKDKIKQLIITNKQYKRKLISITTNL